MKLKTTCFGFSLLLIRFMWNYLEYHIIPIFIYKQDILVAVKSLRGYEDHASLLVVRHQGLSSHKQHLLSTSVITKE